MQGNVAVIENQISPEIDSATVTLIKLQTGLNSVAGTYDQLAQNCDDHAHHIDDAHSQMEEAAAELIGLALLDVLTDGALARGMPVFAAAEAPVQNGRALFGVVNKYEDVGRFTAAQALRILRDKVSPAAIPVELPRNFSYLINLPVALQLGRYPPLKLLDVAEIVGIDGTER